MHKKTVAALLCAAALLCSCDRGEDSDRIYHIYSGGTYIDSYDVRNEPPKNGDKAEFYIPEGMVTNSASRSALTENEKRLYDEILGDLGSMQRSAPLSAESDTYQRVLEFIRLEQLAYTQVSDRRLHYDNDKQQFDVIYTYRFSADEVSGMNIAAEKAARGIMDGITPDMDDYDKLKYFHDYLILNCETNTEDIYADTIYGALVRKKALCEGYAKAFSYLCNLAGIENIIVTGKTNVAHMWNMVKLGGNWYHVDVTWDDPDDNFHKTYPDVILYQYFMVTDSVIRNNHTIWTYPAEPPRANGINENYFVREGTDISDESQFLTASENAILSAVSKGKQGAMVKFETSDMFISVTSDLGDAQGDVLFRPIIEQIRSTYGANVSLNWTDYYGQYRILTYIIEY